MSELLVVYIEVLKVRIKQLETTLRQIAALDQKIVPASDRLAIARSLAHAALAPEQDK
jgi:hypothetical protein